MKIKTYLPIFILFLLVVSMVSCAQKQSARETIKLTKDWKFILADNEAFKNTEFDDSGWRLLNVPHDWSIEGEFSADNPASPGGGALPGGTGWYRKKFQVPETDKDKLIFIDFDGVYQKSEVWINGHYLGMRPYGYISFRYDLTPHLNFGGENVLAVKVDNSVQPNSRWYSGSGIFRNVWLVKTGKVHVGQWGTFITTPEVTAENAQLVIKTRIENQLGKENNLSLRTIIFNPSGKKLTKAEINVNPWKNSSEEFTNEIKIENPVLWSVENPQLYKAVTEVYFDGKLTDSYETLFGIRYFKYDEKEGI